MKTPVIGITLDEDIKKTYSIYPWYASRKNYASAITKNQGLPVFLPHDLKNIIGYSQILDGVVITGGDFDVNPKFYGEKIQSVKVTLKEERTIFEYKLIESCLKNNKPLLAICGGEQLLNVVMGGTLFQDINEEVETNIEHEQKNPRNEGSHSIEIVNNTKLAGIVKTNKIFVNSAHHQAVKKVGKDLIVNANSDDGIIEGIEHKNLKFCIGVQWHPEFLIQKSDENLFSALIKVSGESL